MANIDLAATYAALILADGDVAITAEKIMTLTSAAGIELENIWATLLAKALEGKNVNDLLLNIDPGIGKPDTDVKPEKSQTVFMEDGTADKEKLDNDGDSDDDGIMATIGLFD